jgi:hypothetical protein
MDCLSEMMNVEVWVGDTYEVLLLMAKEFCSFAKLLTKEQQNEAEKRR